MNSEYDEGNRLLSIGDSHSNETGQYYYRARVYSPVQSRFISNDVSKFLWNSKDRWNCTAIPVDTMGMVDGPNMYMYVRNDPVNHENLVRVRGGKPGGFPVNARDPTGRWSGFWGPPMLINGGGGAGLPCPGSSAWNTFGECYHRFIDDGYSPGDATYHCTNLCEVYGGQDVDGFEGMSCEHKVGLLCAGGTAAACWAAAVKAGITNGIGGLFLTVICGMIMYGGCEYTKNRICG